MKNLEQLATEISELYSGLEDIVVPAEQISLQENGLLDTGKSRFPVTREASEQFSKLLKVPAEFYLTLEPDLRSAIFNRRFQARVAEHNLGQDIRISLNENNHIIGYDDPKLLKISPATLMETMNSMLPEGLSAQQIEISRLHINSGTLSFSCFSPQIESQPRVGDIINGGIDVHHSISGEFGTQVRCYLRRQICSNGACIHICEDEKKVRARRLHNGRFDDKDMVSQLERLFKEAWLQLDGKLQAVKELLNKERPSLDFLRRQRTRFSLNNRILREIEIALNQDEAGPTNTQYDFFNALSRVASHDELLTLRQRRIMMFMAGEFSQINIHICPQCHTWLLN